MERLGLANVSMYDILPTHASVGMAAFGVRAPHPVRGCREGDEGDGGPLERPSRGGWSKVAYAGAEPHS